MTKDETDMLQAKVSERLPLASPGEQGIIIMLTLIAGQLENIEHRLARAAERTKNLSNGGPG